MKTIVITISPGQGVRNILRATDILKILKSSNRIVILTPLFNDKSFIAEFGGKNVAFENLARCKLNIMERVLKKIAEIIFFNVNYVETIKLKEIKLRKKNYPKYLGLKLVKKILGKNKNLIKALENLDMLLFRYKCKKCYGNLFEKYRPSLIFSTNYLNPYEWGVIKAARYYKVPVFSMILSWDHLTKGRLPTIFDKVIVWNDILKKQLIEFYGYGPNDIFVSGIPHFDYYIHDKNKLLSKKEFLKSIGAAADKKLITYTTASITTSPYEPDIIEIICKAMKNNEITYPSHLHVRFHPADNFDRYEKLKKYGDIVTFEKPKMFFCDSIYEWHSDRKDMLHYANLLSCSDVIINLASTVTVDAAPFDTPIINVAFDGYEKRPFWDSVIRYHDYTHYKNIVKTGGVKIAKTKDELIRYINEYLRNPKLDTEGRKKIVEEQCYRLDGNSGERVARYILSFFKK